ncbi:MAG: SufE family protein [Chloroflexi bacterium]|nr:SufE family protein [Chloroflexota bacterium]
MMPEKLQEIIENFQVCVGQEKLMYLLEFAEALPDLPEWLVNDHAQMGQVHECMSPVFIAAELEHGRIIYHFDIPRESPTVRGYGGILHQALNGLTPAEVLAVPGEFYLEMGLQQVITGQRLNGMSAILAYMKSLAREKSET